jgi:2-dehydropantoate 2-reductase
MIKKVCIFGVGGLGGYYGGEIANIFSRAGNDRELYFVARGKHLDAIQKVGLVLKTPDGELVCRPDKAVEDFAELPQADLILLCVKGCDIPDAAKAIAKNCKKDAYIVPLLNGVDVYERIREHLDTGIVFPTCVYIASSIEKPGTVTKIGGPCMIHFGKDPKHPAVVPEEVCALFDEMGFSYQWHESALAAIWEKYMFVAAFALYSAYCGKNFGEILASEAAKQEVKNIMSEVFALSKAAGISLRETIVEETLDKANSFPPETKTSYQRDLERNSKGNEGDLFGGTIIKLGRKYGVATDATEHFYHAIKEQ